MTDRRHIGLPLVGMLLGVALLFFAHAAFFPASASATTYCQSDRQCPKGTTCVDSRCALESSVRSRPVDPSADDECSADRRCRIRRLARKNRARRQIQITREEAALESLIERTERHRQEKITRQNKPWTLDLAASTEHESGLAGGYAFTPRIKAEVAAYWPRQFVYASVGDVSVDGSHDYTLFSVGPTYYFSESNFSAYAKAAFMYGTGDFRPYGSYGFDGGSLLQTETHALSVGGGLDVQFDLGFHVRLGANYRMLLFNEASVQTGEYDDITRKALENEFYPIDVVFLIGWAL